MVFFFLKDLFNVRRQYYGVYFLLPKLRRGKRIHSILQWVRIVNATVWNCVLELNFWVNKQ